MAVARSGVGLVGLIVAAVAIPAKVFLIDLPRDKRIVQEAEALVEDYLRDLPRLVQSGRYYSPDGSPLPRPDVSSDEDAKEELARLKFLAEYGAVSHLSGGGFSRPKYAGMLTRRLEMSRTAHAAKGVTTIQIYVTGTQEKAPRVERFFGSDQIWVRHPDFE